MAVHTIIELKCQLNIRKIIIAIIYFLMVNYNKISVVPAKLSDGTGWSENPTLACLNASQGRSIQWEIQLESITLPFV
jgi:hypothetical protein